jgi:hypothetical protein
MIFFADLFGFEERYNLPGTRGPDNWTLRLPPTFEREFENRRARGAALDLSRAVEMALEARGSLSGDSAAIARTLRASRR